MTGCAAPHGITLAEETYSVSQATVPQNKGMKLTRSAPAREPRPLQLIPSVRPTVREQHEEAAPGMSTAPV